MVAVPDAALIFALRLLSVPSIGIGTRLAVAAVLTPLVPVIVPIAKAPK